MTRDQLLARVSEIRLGFYDRTQKFSHGLGALFQENFRAAVSILYGDGKELMRTGHFADDYAEAFASDMGMTSKEWAGWIVEQNRKFTQKVFEVEREYLRMTYGSPSTVTEDKVNDYQAFCEAP